MKSDESNDREIKEQLNQQYHPDLKIIATYQSFPEFAASSAELTISDISIHE